MQGVQLIREDFEHNVVRNQFSPLHQFLGHQPDLGPARIHVDTRESAGGTSPVRNLLPLEDVLAENVSGRQGHDVVLLDEPSGQGAFTSPGFPKHDHPQHLSVSPDLPRFIFSPRSIEE